MKTKSKLIVYSAEVVTALFCILFVKFLVATQNNIPEPTEPVATLNTNMPKKTTKSLSKGYVESITMKDSLFGVNLFNLLRAIAFVESDCGLTSNNIYQLEPCFIKDCNRIIARRTNGNLNREFSMADAYNQSRSEYMMYLYWHNYGFRYYKITGKQPNAEVLARIHNGGPDGWKKPATIKYWNKVKARLASIE